MLLCKRALRLSLSELNVGQRVLQLKTYRLFGHAGADAEVAYRRKQQIESELEQDPLLFATALMLARGIVDAEQLAEQVQALDAQTARVAAVAVGRPKLTSAAAVMKSIVPPHLDKQLPARQARADVLAFDKHNLGKPQHLAKIINWTLHEIMAQLPTTVVLGEDVGKKGGVYNVTQQLVHQFGNNRVLNTLLDEQSILGLGIGLAQQGFLPIPDNSIFWLMCITLKTKFAVKPQPCHFSQTANTPTRWWLGSQV